MVVVGEAFALSTHTVRKINVFIMLFKIFLRRITILRQFHLCYASDDAKYE